MKKWIALLLLVAIMIGLCGCGDANARKSLANMGITDRDTQNALIDAAKELYADEPSAQSSSGSRMDEIYEESLAQYGSQLEGSWIKVDIGSFTNGSFLHGNTDPYYNLSFEGSGVRFGNVLDRTWLVEDGKILMGFHMDGGKEQRYNVTEIEFIDCAGFDMLRLENDNGYIQWYVRSEKAEELYNAMFYTLELNSENVHDYFEIESIHQDEVDSFGEKTGKYRQTLYLCHTASRKGLYSIINENRDILIEVTCPDFEYIKSPWLKHKSGFTVKIQRAEYSEVETVYDNRRTNEMEAALSAEDVTIGRAKGTVKYLREEFIDHIDYENPSLNTTNGTIYDLFGNQYSTRDGIPPETVRKY